MSYVRAFPTSPLLFILIVLLEPLSSMAGLFDDEERRKGRQPTVLQSLGTDFKKEIDAIDEVLFSPDVPSTIQGYVLTYMREQGFVVSSELTGSASTVSVKGEVLLERQTAYKKAVSLAFPPDMPLAAYAKIMDSSEFSDVLDDAAYVLLMQAWQKKLERGVPYTNFLPGLSLRNGMIVLCPHPQDVDATRQFLSLFYNALKRLRSVDPKPFIPDHAGLRQVFRTFEDNHQKKKEILDLWGASLLEGIKQFYREQRVLFGWEYTARAIAVAKEDISRSFQTLVVQLSNDLKLLEKFEEEYSLPMGQRLKNTLKIPGNDLQTIENALTTWQALLLEQIKQALTNQQDFLPNTTYKSKEKKVDKSLKKVRLKITKYRSLSRELHMITAAFSVAQYFSDHREIQFVNPFQARKNLKSLDMDFSQTSSTGLPLLVPIYRCLRELLSFTLPQMEQFSNTVSVLLTRLPALSFVPAQHQVHFQRAYSSERNAAIDAYNLFKEERAENLVLSRLERNILGKSDTPDKQRVMLLQNRARYQKLTDEEEETLKKLKSTLIEEELALHDSPLGSVSRIDYLNAQKKADKAKFLYDVAELRHQKASLSLEYIKRSFISWAMETSGVEKDKRTPIDEERRKLMAESKKVDEKIAQLQKYAQEVTDSQDKKIEEFRMHQSLEAMTTA